MVETISMGLIWGLCFIFSTTCHEAAHAWTALKGGDPTAYEAGQVTLNPLPHIQRSPLGMVVVPIAAFMMAGYMIGWASAPYNPYWAANHPHRSARMALAGPAANFILVILSLVVIGIGARFFGIAPGSEIPLKDVLWDLFVVAFQLNVILCLFNLIPIRPLDGSEGILIFFPEHRASEIRAKLDSVGNFGILIAWVLFSFLYPPIGAATPKILSLVTGMDLVFVAQ